MEIGLAEREGHQSDLVSGVKGGRVEVGGGERRRRRRRPPQYRLFNLNEKCQSSKYCLVGTFLFS